MYKTQQKCKKNEIETPKIHQKHLQVLMTETYKIVNGTSPPIIYIRENTHNMRNFQEISNENRKTVKYELETISNRTSFFWANLFNEYKLATSLHGFKLTLRLMYV